MLHTLCMPKLSPTMTEGVIAKWHKKSGDKIEAGDLLMEIATDKATIEHYAIDPGWLRECVAHEGATVEVNSIVAFITDGEKEPYEKSAIKPAAPQEKKKEEVPIIESKPIDSSQERIFASPLAKKIAKENRIDLSHIQGSGPRGRIMSRDLAQETNTSPQSTQQKIPLSQMRKAIAERLSYSKKTMPHFYLTIATDITDLVHIREDLKKENFSYTVTDFIVKASARALKESPNMRMSFDEQEKAFIHYPNVDISLAVAVEGGLITPLLFQADRLSLDALSKEIKRVAEKARASKLTPDEYTGGCFTISNLGMYGISEFYAILNPPQSAILAVGAMEEQLKRIGSEIVTRNILKLSLSVDHRVIDGAVAAQFLQLVKKYLEKPSLLLLC